MNSPTPDDSSSSRRKVRSPCIATWARSNSLLPSAAGGGGTPTAAAPPPRRRPEGEVAGSRQRRSTGFGALGRLVRLGQPRGGQRVRREERGDRDDAKSEGRLRSRR